MKILQIVSIRHGKYSVDVSFDAVPTPKPGTNPSSGNDQGSPGHPPGPRAPVDPHPGGSPTGVSGGVRGWDGSDTPILPDDEWTMTFKVPMKHSRIFKSWASLIQALPNIEKGQPTLPKAVTLKLEGIPLTESQRYELLKALPQNVELILIVDAVDG